MILLELHGGFDHYGYSVQQSETDARLWTISYYTEQGQRLLTTITNIEHMKLVYIIGCTFFLSVIGCKREPAPAQSPPEQPKMVSDGSSTWTLGAVTMNGTNVPLSNINIRAITNQAPK